MAVRVLDSQGRRAGLPGKRASIYTVDKNGGMLFDDYQLGLIVFRSTTQSIAASTWASVVFDTKYQMMAISTLMWTSGANVTILESDWYFLSASIQFDTVGQNTNTYQRFRFSLSTGITLPGDVTYVPTDYTWNLSAGIPYYITAGTTLTLDVSHTRASSMTLLSGLVGACLKIGKVTG